MRILSALAFIWVCASSAAPSCWAASFPDRYDSEIRAAVDRWWPDHRDWLDWKAQLYQESRLDPAARSPAGAEGLAQFMPATWAEVSRAMGYGLIPRSMAGPAIEAGAYYMATLRRSWSSPRPDAERHRLAQASYNAGLGNILKAQRLCGGARFWNSIAVCLELVTGPRNAAETIGYVDRIARWRAMMGAGL